MLMAMRVNPGGGWSCLGGYCPSILSKRPFNLISGLSRESKMSYSLYLSAPVQLATEKTTQTDML